MSEVKLFESQQVRRVWNASDEQWYFFGRRRGGGVNGLRKSYGLLKSVIQSWQATWGQIVPR